MVTISFERRTLSSHKIGVQLMLRETKKHASLVDLIAAIAEIFLGSNRNERH